MYAVRPQRNNNETPKNKEILIKLNEQNEKHVYK